MRNRNLKALLLSGSLALLAANLTAQRAEEAVPTPGQPPSSDTTPSYKDKDYKNKAAQLPAIAPDTGASLKASTIIGQPVRNAAGERLGKLTDIIVNFESHSAPFAIVESGGKLGLGAVSIAVPLSEFRWSSESKQLLLTATKEEFQSANPAPTGAWIAVAGENWTKHVDKYYGQPSSVDKSRFERQESTDVIGGRQPVRNPTEAKSANEFLNATPGAVPEEKNIVAKPTDEDLMTKVNSLVRGDVGQDAENIQVTVKDGVVTLRGKATASQKQALQRNIKALPGVTRIEDNLEDSKD